MSPILSLSVLILFVAVVWSIVLMVDLREWRLGLVCLTLVALTGHAAADTGATSRAAEWSSLVVSMTALLAMVLIRRILTDRTRLKKQRSLMANILESTSDAISSAALNGTITSWNAGAEELFGYTANEAIGSNLSMLIPVDRLNDFSIIKEKVGHVKLANNYETVRLHNSGRPISVSLTV